jgi:type IV pilus assembly protein PilE
MQVSKLMEKTMQKCVKTVGSIGMKKVSLNAGFTLIELMVVLAIMAILTMVAYPGYQESIRKTRRSDGISAALRIQVAQEKFRANCAFYAQTLGGANTCGANAGASTVVADSDSGEGFYAMTILANSATGNAYTIVADPQNAQLSDTACDPMTIAFSAGDPNGDKQPAACWP